MTFATATVDPATLQLFFAKVRPFGLWPKAWKEPWQAEHREDLWTLSGALLWQILTFLLPMVAMLRMGKEVAIGERGRSSTKRPLR